MRPTRLTPRRDERVCRGTRLKSNDGARWAGPRGDRRNSPTPARAPNDLRARASRRPGTGWLGATRKRAGARDEEPTQSGCARTSEATNRKSFGAPGGQHACELPNDSAPARESQPGRVGLWVRTQATLRRCPSSDWRMRRIARTSSCRTRSRLMPSRTPTCCRVSLSSLR